MAMPESTPRRPGKPGQNRDSRDGVFGHPESQLGPLPRVGFYARVLTPHPTSLKYNLTTVRSDSSAGMGKGAVVQPDGRLTLSPFLWSAYFDVVLTPAAVGE